MKFQNFGSFNIKYTQYCLHMNKTNCVDNIKFILNIIFNVYVGFVHIKAILSILAIITLSQRRIKMNLLIKKVKN